MTLNRLDTLLTLALQNNITTNEMIELRDMISEWINYDLADLDPDLPRDKIDACMNARTGREIDSIMSNNLISSVDIVEILEKYIVIEKREDDYFGICPFHPSKGFPFMIDRDLQTYDCAGCAATGNVVDFLMRYLGANYHAALIILEKYINSEEEDNAR